MLRVAPGDPATVVVADDHGVLRGGLRALLSEQEDFAVVGEAADADEVLGVVGRERPDVVLLDLHMPGARGTDAIPRLLELSPETRVVVLTMEADGAFAARALRAGAVGYVLKESAPFVLLEAMRTVLEGGVYLQPELGAKLARRPSADPLDTLTDREREVLVGVARGETNRELAERLHLSVRTVETHRARLQGKLGVSGPVALTDLARRHGLVDAGPVS